MQNPYWLDSPAQASKMARHKLGQLDPKGNNIILWRYYPVAILREIWIDATYGTPP